MHNIRSRDFWNAYLEETDIGRRNEMLFKWEKPEKQKRMLHEEEESFFSEFFDFGSLNDVDRFLTEFETERDNDLRNLAA